MYKEIKEIKLKSKLPSENEVKIFIKSKDDYEHDTRQIFRFFLGNEDIADVKINNRVYNILWKKAEKVRSKITIEENGRWIKREQGFGQPIQYYFVKRNLKLSL